MAEQVDGVSEHAARVLGQARGWVDAVVPGGSETLSASRVLGGLAVGVSLGHVLAPKTVDEAVGLVPHHAVFTVTGACPIPFVWNVATSHFYEANLLKAAVATPFIVLLTQFLERLWSAKAIAAHVLFTVTCAGATFLVAELAHVYRTQHEKDFFIPVRGCVGLVVALAVGVRHAYPLEPAPLLPRGFGVQCQHVPFAITAAAALVGALAPGNFSEWLFAPAAFFFGWLHLRYLMWFPTAQAHGDHSPDFLFASLFPRPLRPLVGCLGAIAHSVSAAVAPGFVRLRAQADGSSGSAITFDPTTANQDGAFASSAALGTAASVGAGSAEYAARRAKALALLDRNIDTLLAPSAALPSRPRTSPPEDAELDERINMLLASRSQPRAEAHDLESAGPPPLTEAAASSATGEPPRLAALPANGAEVASP